MTPTPTTKMTKIATYVPSTEKGSRLAITPTATNDQHGNGHCK